MTAPAREIWVVAEPSAGPPAPVSLETAAFARRLAEAAENYRVRGVVLGHPAQDPARDFARATGLEVLAADHEALALYNGDVYTAALAELALRHRPAYILIPHTATGWDYAPRLAVAVNGSCISGVNDLRPGDPAAFRRSAYSGKMILEIAPPPDRIAVITVMPGAARPKTVGPPGAVLEVRLGSPELERRAARSHTLGYREAASGGLDLGRAEVIVAAGRGLAGPEHLGLAHDLAACFDKSAVGASRPVVDAGWLPYEHQVGQTGQTVAPRLYLALGISGAIQHTVGMDRSELIVAVNRDPHAAIFNLAHLGVVADLHEFLPALTEKLRRVRREREGAKP